jgi:hypothetical protein
MELFVGVLAILALIALVIAGPLLIIWSLNTLFGLTIAYTLKTWAAAAIFGAMFKSYVRSGKE